MGTASPTAMEGCGCDLANASRANWGAKIDPMPEIGAAVDPRSEPASSGVGNIAPNVTFGRRHHDRGSVWTNAECLALARWGALPVSSARCALHGVLGGVRELGVRADRRPQARRPCRWRVSIRGPGAPDRSSWDQGFASRRRKSWFRAWGAACGGAEGDAGSSNGWGSRLYSVQQGSSSPLTGSVSAIFPAPRFRPQA